MRGSPPGELFPDVPATLEASKTLLDEGFTVLPYVTVSLISGLGSLHYAEAKILFVKVGGLLLVLWGLTRIDPVAGMPIVVGWVILGITSLWDTIADIYGGSYDVST